jgi:paraquat-inducible protein B
LAGRITTAAKVGAFAVVMVGAGLLIYRYVTKSGDGDGGYVVFTRMKDASGIAKMSQVRIAGIPVGRVKSIKLDRDVARIDIVVNKEVPLYEDAAAAKVASSLLGEFQMKIAPGTEGRRKLVDGDEIKVVTEAQTPDDLMRQMSDIAKDVKEVSKALAASVGSEEGKADIQSTLRNLATKPCARTATRFTTSSSTRSRSPRRARPKFRRFWRTCAKPRARCASWSPRTRPGRAAKRVRCARSSNASIAPARTSKMR